jgi:hypothetical protein
VRAFFLSVERDTITENLLICQCSTRQDMREALQLAARGKVKCRYVERRWDELNEYVSFCVLDILLMSFYVISILNELEEGKVAGRIVVKF